MKNYMAGNRGLIKTIILVVVALIVLGYLGFNLRDIINSPTVQDNFHYSKEVIVNTWNSYLKTPATYVWNIITHQVIIHTSSTTISTYLPSN